MFMSNVKKMTVMMLAMMMAIGLLAMPVFAQNQPPHTPVPTVTPTIAPTRAPIVITMTQDDINTVFTPVYSTQLLNVVVTLGDQQVFVDFEGIGPNFKKQQFNAVAVPQFVPVVGKVTWIVTAMTLDGQPMTEVLFTTWARRVHNMLDARMPKRFKGFIVTAVDITPEELTYTQVLR
jgi:hypothetical protein